MKRITVLCGGDLDELEMYAKDKNFAETNEKLRSESIQASSTDKQTLFTSTK